MKIYLDLDGPIFDVRKRSWTVHARVVEELGGKPFGDWLYFWKQKQVRTSKATILSQCGLDPALEQKYLGRYIALIELEKYLALDRLVAGVKSALASLIKFNTLILVSLRKNVTGATKQIEKLKLEKYFDRLLIGGEKKGEAAHLAKKRMILAEAEKSGELGQLIVGDDEVEILAARSLNIASVGVLGGIRSYQYLKKLNPTFIIKHLSQLPTIIVSLRLKC